MGSLRGAFDGAPQQDSGWWWPFALTGAVAALPYLLCEVLPAVDFPLHQLELGIWLDALAGGERFGAHYEVGPYTLPYWTTSALGALFAPLLGVEAGARAVLALYVFALPLAAAWLCRETGRSPWWGLAITPFTYEFNLSWGFTAYCFAGLVLLAVMAACARATRTSANRDWALALGLALLLGWTHPQVAAVSTGLCVYLTLFAPTRGTKLRLVAVGAISFSIPLIWLLSASGAASDNFAGGLQYEALPVLLERLLLYSVDTLPGYTEEALLALVLLLLAASWSARPGVWGWDQRKLLIIPLTCFAMYFVAPFNLSGQAVCQRMPYLTLLFLPLLAAPCHPGRYVKGALLGIALLGATQTASALVGFDAEAQPGLQAMIERAPRGARTLYVPYDVDSDWVRTPGYSHVGALLTLRRGGVYATNFDRLTIRYRSHVDREGTIMGHEYALYTAFRERRKVIKLKARQVAWWDLHLVRLPAEQPVSPTDLPHRAVEVLGFESPWSLTRPR